MEIKRVNLDRTKLSSDYIERKQDLKGIVNQARVMKPIEWKSPWFYGAIGLSSVAFASLMNFDFDSSNLTNEKEYSSKDRQYQKEDMSEFFKNNVLNSTQKKDNKV